MRISSAESLLWLTMEVCRMSLAIALVLELE